MTSVVSSDIASVGYEAGSLCIQFRSGGKYMYYGVPASVYQGLMSADSHGKYFHAHVKPFYAYTRLI